MKKTFKKILAALMAVALIIPSMPITANAATNTYNLSVYSKKTTNPTAPFSLDYFDTSDYTFKTMEAFMEQSNANNNYWAVKDANGTLIKGWVQQATSTEYAVVRFTAPSAGEVAMSREAEARTGVFSKAGGDFMIVQKSGDNYAPIWPTKGSWTWENIAVNGATSFVTTGANTYVNAGDEILFIIRSQSATSVTSANINYKVALTTADTDTNSLRPTTWDSYFKGADDKLVTGNVFKSSPYVKKSTNVDSEAFTKEYITSAEGLQKLDKYIEDASNPYWQLSTNANVESKPWYMKATANAYNAMVYNAPQDGYVRFTNSYQLFTSGDTGNYDNAQAMLVLSNGSGYYPVWPTAGSWEWKDVPTGTATAGVVLDATTYMKAGDKLALVVRSSNTAKGVTWMQSDCNAYMTPVANDYRGLYPAESAFSSTFEGYEWRMPFGPYTEQEQSWHMQKESSDVFTAEYNAGEGFVQMENYISDANPKYWQSANGQAMIKTYMQTATANTHSAVVFHVPVTGYLKVENAYKPIYTHYSSSGAYEPAQLIIVQKSTDSEGKEIWSPIWPSRGEWKYETLPMRTSSSDTTTGIELKATSYAKAGDEIYFVSRSGLESTGSTAIQSNLEVFYTESATDDGNLYPTVWSDSYQYAKAEVEFETELANVTIAAEDGQIRELLQYRPVFKDDDRANPIFNNVPEELLGKSFIATDCWGDSVGWTKTATATSDGWVYAFVTNSKASKVVADGFKYVPLDITDLFFGANANGSDNCKLYKKYVNAGDTITIYDRWMLLVFETLDDKSDYTLSDSFIPPVVVYANDAEAVNYAKAERKWQGCAGVVQTSDDVMYATWVSGGEAETLAGNYQLFVRSTDGGDTWEEYMYLGSDDVTTKNKVSDGSFYLTEEGRLWLFVSSTRQGNNYHGIWAMYTDNPNDANPTWSEPKWIAPGVINTKLTVLSDGTWIMATMALHHDTDYTDIWASDDEGETWYLRGMAYVPETYVDEACIVELNDGRLWLTVRSTTDRGIEESYSSDGGYTWTSGEKSELNGPGSKFIVRRLESGNLLLINHYEYMGRDHMAALLSTDDGKTWPHVLMLDERTTSYPYVTTWNYDGTEVINVIYDHERYDAKQIYTARFTEEDIINGSFDSEYAREKYLIDSLSGDALFDYNNSWFVQQNTNPYTWGYCTYGYFDGNAFKTMETYVPADADGNPAHWQSASGESSIITWRVFGSKNESPTISFFIGKSGYLEISEDAANPLQANGDNRQFMIVQVNGDGEYCPLYPEVGKWTWKDISTTPTDIGTIRTYMNSDDKVFLIWKNAGESDFAVETMAHFKFTYSSTDTEDIYTDYTWTRWLGGGELETNQTKADEVSAQMKSLAGITLADVDKVKAVREAYKALNDVQKALVDGMEYLAAAEQKIANLKKDVNCVAYVETLQNALPKEISDDSLQAYKEVAAAYQMLTAEEKATLKDKDSLDALVEGLESYIVSSEKVQRVENLINEIPLPYELTNRKYLEKAYGAFKELTVAEQEMVENRPFLQALRRITGLKDSSQNLPNYEVALINELPSADALTLADAYDVEYALGFYTALTEAQKGSVSNYATLQAAVEKMETLQKEAEGVSYTVTAEAAENGTIISAGTNDYSADSTVVYQIVPFVGYEVKDVLVDGVSVGAVNTYTFEELSANHTIEAVFVVEAEEAEVWNNNISWYIQQNQQPWSGSYYTFEYFDVDTKEFKKLETHVADANPAYWQDETGTAIIKAWQQFASNQKYSAVTFTAGEQGVVTLTNNTTVTGKVVDGEFMLLQRKGDLYSVLLDWTTIPAGQSVTLPNVETYVESGDIIYYLYRSTSETVSVLEMVPGVGYVIGVEDTNSQYPTTWTDLNTAIYGEMPTLRISSATLKLENDITVVFKSKSEMIDDIYTDVYAVVTQELENGETKSQTITGVKSEDGNYYEFKYTGVAAKEVGDLMDITIYGYRNGILVTGETKEGYGIMSYCLNQLKKSASDLGFSEERMATFKTLLVDIINYASEAQIYFGYKTDALVSEQLTEEYKDLASDDGVLDRLTKVTDPVYATIENPSVTWNAATLQLLSRATIRLKATYTGNVEDIKLYAKVAGKIFEVTQYEAISTNGAYYFYFDEITAFQFDEPIDFYFVEGDTVISNTLRYSVESYAMSKLEDEKVGAVVRAMMKYGKAANTFAGNEDTLEVNRALFYGVCYCAYEAKDWYDRDVTAEIQAMSEIGAKSTRVWMRSSHMMNDSETFNTNAVAIMKDIIATAQGQGIEVIGMNCDWFNGTDDHMAVPTRNLETGSDYMKFLADYEETWYQMALKFQEIDTWEIGNEWNNDTFLHPLDYKENGTTFTASEKAAIATDMLYYASKGIHRGNSNAKTVLGGLVDVYETGYGDAKTFLEMIYTNIESFQCPSNNPDDFFQIAAWHPYNHSGAPNADWVQRQKDIYQVILDHEGHDKVVLFTEMGLSDYGDAQKDADQKDDVIATLTLIRDELSFVQSVHWFRMFNEANAESWGGAFETGFGLFTEPDENGNFEMKAKGEAYLEMTGGK